jgi:hypothetical protein
VGGQVRAEFFRLTHCNFGLRERMTGLGNEPISAQSFKQTNHHDVTHVLTVVSMHRE